MNIVNSSQIHELMTPVTNFGQVAVVVWGNLDSNFLLFTKIKTKLLIYLNLKTLFCWDECETQYLQIKSGKYKKYRTKN